MVINTRFERCTDETLAPRDKVSRRVKNVCWQKYLELKVHCWVVPQNCFEHDRNLEDGVLVDGDHHLPSSPKVSRKIIYIIL